MPKHAGWKLVYYEAYPNEQDARARERMLKQYGAARGHLKTTYSAQHGVRKCWVIACLLLNESASYYQWRA